VANWHDKPGNLEMIASELSLGLDSVVFLDDSPMERALVRSRLPQVVVPECGQTPWEMLAALRRGLYFESTTLTKEDLARSESYQQNVARKSLERQSASLEEFLSDLKMVAEHGAVSDRTLPRVTQLINKTNQFNLTARRYTEEQVRAMATSPHWWCRWFKLSDRFGDHGLIGVILAEKSGPSWRVDTWLMSCRVLGRGIEQFMCDCLMAAAREEDAIEIVGEYTATERNTLVRDLYQRLGFRPCSEDGSRYSLDPRSEGRPRCPFIRESREDHETTGVD
jgi:FkbH-like protein